MMYGFGDETPLESSAELLGEYVYRYVEDLTQKALRISSKRGRIQNEDLLFILQKDRKKLARAQELLMMNAIINEAKRNLNPTEPT